MSGLGRCPDLGGSTVRTLFNRDLGTLMNRKYPQLGNNSMLHWYMVKQLSTSLRQVVSTPTKYIEIHCCDCKAVGVRTPRTPTVAQALINQTLFSESDTTCYSSYY